MSDKSFGDYSNRNIVKNPLLSNAVTGLSIEDLTHNTFLLPAVRNQGLISSQDSMQNVIESNTEKTDFQSGDTKSNIQSITSDLNTSPITTVLQSVPLTPNANVTQSIETTVTTVKPKSEDDFDVNEYFARLQGTRYVSAPKNCPLNEDQNVNLQATEESLEEINLNDSQNSDDTGHSITADIAQNFSQLPQVLPQVASAVFSSFSNMLSLKSREQTPEFDSNKGVQSYVGFEKNPYESGTRVETVPDIGSTNYNVTENSITAPPPKEPPRFSSTPTTYRMTAKKKTYAPIPGLSSGDVSTVNSQGPTFQIPKQEMPIFFNPSLQTNLNTIEINPELADKNRNLTGQYQHSQIDHIKTEVTSNIESFVSKTEPIKMYQPQINAQFQQTAVNLLEPVIPCVTENQSTGQIIPPPPMFTNVPVKIDENTPSISRSVLPPSVARRNTSVQQTKTTNIPCETNFFIPHMLPENLDQDTTVKAKLNSLNDMTTDKSIFKSDLPESSHVPPNFYNPLTNESKIGTALPRPELFNIHHSQIKYSNVIEPPKNESEISLQAPSVVQNLYNPLLFETKSEKNVTENTLQNLVESQAISTTNAFTSSNPTSQIEPSKIVTEPPKLPSNQTYRLIKKKPQYYSGPIDGVGSVSNNVKPVLPSYEQSNLSNTFYQGTLFTPNQTIAPESTPLYSANESSQFNQTTIENHTVFDISRPANNEAINVQSYSPLDLNMPSTSSQNQPNYEYMAFDTSRATTETYNTSKQESATYGLLGSLKSKLGAIDINKIQNTVTTFFDPGYSVKSNEQKYISPHNQSCHETNLEIFVPNFQQHTHPEFHYNTGYDNYSIANPQPSDNHQYQNQYTSGATDHQNTSAVMGENYAQNSETPLLYNYSNPILPHDPITQIQASTQIVKVTSKDSGISATENQQSVTVTSPITTGSIPNIKDINENNVGTSHVNFASLPVSQNQNSSEKKQSENLPLEVCNLTTFLSKIDSKVKNRNADDPSNFFNVSHIQDTAHVNFASMPVPQNQNSSEKKQSENLPLEVCSLTTFLSKIDSKVKNRNADDPSNFFNVSHIQDTDTSVISDLSERDTLASGTTFFTLPNFITNESEAGEIPIKDNRISNNLGNINSDPKLQTPNLDNEKAVIIKSDTISTNILTASAIEQDVFKSNNSNIEKESSKNNLIKKVQTTSPNEILFFSVPKLDVTKTSTDISFDNKNSPKYNFALPNLQQQHYNIIEKPSRQTGTDNLISKDNKEKNIEFEINKLSSSSEETSPQSKVHLEQKMRNLHITEHNYFHENTKDCFDVYDNKYLSVNFESLVIDDKGQDTLEILSDNELNICETCREVNKPEEKDVDDLTSHLIENITAPIQLQNPVEAPLPDSKPVPETPPDFTNLENEKLCESSMFTDNSNIVNYTSINNDSYGWGSENTQLDESSNLMLDDINAYINANPNPLVGYFGEESLYYNNQPYIPTNASDEIKAEFSISDNKSMLQSLIGVPSAPNLADIDDQNILDVQQIEQDAKNDFPMYDDYVIEPSETDDDKIECRERRQSSEDESQEIDSFTNRVDKYKKLEETSNYLESSNNSEKDCNVYEYEESDVPLYQDFLSKSSQVEYLTSYLDSTNYAEVEQFRNSTESPDFTPLTNAPQRINLPLRNITDALDLSFSGFHKKQKTPLPPTSLDKEDFDNEIIKNQEIYKEVTDVVKTPSHELQTNHETINSNEPQTFKLFDNSKLAQESSSESVLTDHMNFFSTNETTNVTKLPESETEASSNRLASYFASPPKTDSTKSFFELSQSQDHYRQNTKNSNSHQNSGNQGPIEFNQMSTKSFFELGQSQNHYKDNNEQLETFKLINDLTSCKNFTPNKDDVVKTVNYFLVEYDINNVKKNCDKIVEANNVDVDSLKFESTFDEMDRDLLVKVEGTLLDRKNIPLDCKHCCNIIEGFNKSIGNLTKENYKFRKAMNSETKNTGSNNGESDNFPEVHTGGTRKKGFNVNFDEALSDAEEGTPEADENRGSTEYVPVKHHWFYRVDTEGKSAWLGFSQADSKALEEAFLSPDLTETSVIATDGGRFDVNVIGRLRVAVYWSEKPTNVRRCSWFYKGSDVGYVPYTEPVAELLEDEYRNGVTTGVWHRRITLPNNEAVVMHSPTVMVHFPPYSTDTWGGGAFRKRVRRNPPTVRVTQDQTHKIDHLVFIVHGAGEWKNQKHKNQSTLRPLMVTRGYEEAIQDEQPTHIDHLLMFCHGVGPVCDMSFRSVEQVVNDFRATSLKLTQSHYKNSCDSGAIGRVEMLPISWHSTLHSGENGVDSRLAQITLESIPKLRNFTNDTILDVLFYTSPTYSQTIIDAVCKELNRIYTLFKQRNPNFKGGISLAGHSLGSVILYDLLCNQHSDSNPGPSQKTYVQSSSCTVQPNVKYPHLEFCPDALYALGSPIAIFEFIRGVESIGEKFSLPTCPSFFNIFHPYDPIAYRVEPLINPELKSVQPYLIPHHKGRKRMHLELKDTMARVSADIKQKLLEVVKASWYSMWRTQPPTTQQLEKVVEEVEKEKLMECKEDTQQEMDSVKEKMLGQLNQGRRIDYVLQEAPIEMFNEYIFAIRSHVCYWESEDVMLLMLREIYLSLGVQPDCSVPQQSMTVERTRTASGNEDPMTISTISEIPTTSRKAE